MDEQPNLQNFVNEISSFSDEGSTPVKAASPTLNLQAIGEVLEIAGSGSRIRMKSDVLAANHEHSDPSVAMSGQVGSQVKMAVANSWLDRQRPDDAARRQWRDHCFDRLPR